MSGAYGEADEWRQPTSPLRTSGTATLALAAGVLSFFCLFGFGGVLAIALGWLAHGEIERSGGRLAGKGIASTGIALGIASLVVTVVGVAALVALAVRPEPPSAALTPRAPYAPPAVVATPSAPSSPAPAPRTEAEAVEAAPALPTLPPHIGKIVIVEAAVGGDRLELQLLSQLEQSAQAGERLVLWTVTTDCEPCDEVGQALTDARMQRALGKVRLVRADTASFPRELRQLGIPSGAVPGFTLLDARAHPLDHIHGGEWDDNVPANMAPVLDKFLRHTLTQRRHPWARPLREGETPL
jgi:hypothetical protein